MPRQCNSSPSASPCDPPCSSSSNAIDPPTSEAGNESWVDDGLRETDLDDENSASTTRSRSSHRRISPKSTLVVRRVNEDEEDVRTYCVDNFVCLMSTSNIRSLTRSGLKNLTDQSVYVHVSRGVGQWTRGVGL